MLDAGCGTGRHAYFAASYGAREVVALDLSVAVDAARGKPARVRRVSRSFKVISCAHRSVRPPQGEDSISSTRSACCTISEPVRRFNPLFGTSVPAERSQYGCMATRTTASSVTWSNPFAACRPKVSPPLLRGLAWPLAVGFHAAERGVPAPLREETAFRCAAAERVHVERCRIQLPSELRHRVRPARCTDRRVHQRTGASPRGSSANGSRTWKSRIDTKTRGAAVGGCRSPRTSSVDPTEANPSRASESRRSRPRVPRRIRVAECSRSRDS